MGRRKGSDSCENIKEEQGVADKRPSQEEGCGNIAEGDKKNDEDEEDEDEEEEENKESTGQMGVMLREVRLGLLMRRVSGWMREETSSASRAWRRGREVWTSSVEDERRAVRGGKEEEM